MSDETRPAELLPAIRRARIDNLDIYEISEQELQLLERGSPESVYLNFAVFLLSSAVSLLSALVTMSVASLHVFTVFVVLTSIGFVGGVFLLCLWFRNRESTLAVLAQIRRRMPPDGVPEAVQGAIPIEASAKEGEQP